MADEPTQKEKELQAEVDRLKADAETAKTEATEAQTALKIARDTALKQVKAQATVLEKHNIKFDATKADVSKLSVDGEAQVQGDFEYEPAKPEIQQEQKIDTTPTPLTVDEIKNMSKEEINSRWEEVQKTMQGGY